MFAWLHTSGGCRSCWERRSDVHEAFLKLACCPTTVRQLSSLRELLLDTDAAPGNMPG